jgi:drug/metabolite transporter (DMT)-like permease
MGAVPEVRGGVPGPVPVPDAPPVRTPMTSRGTSNGAFTPLDWALLLFVGAVFGSSFFLMEIGLTSLSPAVITFIRLALGYITLSFFSRARKADLTRSDSRRVSAIGLIWLGIPLMLFPIAQLWIDSSVAGMLNGAMPLMTVGWTVLLARTLPGRNQTLGLVVGFLGIVAVALPEIPVGQLGTRQTLLGAALALTAATLYGLSATLVTPLQQRYGSLAVMYRAQRSAIVFVLPFALLGLRDSTVSAPALLAMVPLGVLGTALAFIAIATLMGRVGAPRGSIAVYLVPVVSIALGVTFLGEQVHPLAVAGALLIIVGAWLTSRREDLT